MEIMQNIGNEAVLSAILDAYPYQIVLCDRNHIIRYMNKNAAERYNGRIAVGDSIFGCHREDTCRKIEAFLARADAGEDEMFSDDVRHKRSPLLHYFSFGKKRIAPFCFASSPVRYISDTTRISWR